MNNREIAIIGLVEISAGLLESVIIPNLGRKKGEKFALPAKANILSSAVVLTGTGIVSGVVADSIMETWQIGEDQRMKRVAVIAGTAIAFNLIEALLVDNIVHHRAKIENWELPSFKKFAANFSVLAVMGLGVGIFSDQLIAATAPALKSPDLSSVLADKSTLETKLPE